MSYESRIAQVQEIVQSHNSQSDSKVDWDSFLKNLKQAGGTTEETLKLCSFEDLEKFGLPRLLARQVATTIFRDNQTPTKKTVTELRAKSMTALEALQHYDPREDNPVSDRLKKLSKGLRCIIFNDDGTVNIEHSSKLITEIQDGFGERLDYIFNGNPVRVFQVGERPHQWADENPLYHGRLLRPDGTCDQTNRSWNGVSLKIRQIIYLAVKSGQIVVDFDKAHEILDMCLRENAEKDITTRYTKATIRYQELEKIGALPTLKVKRSESSSNDPFYGGLRRG